MVKLFESFTPVDRAPGAAIASGSPGPSGGPAVSVRSPKRIALSISASSPMFPFDGSDPYASEQYRMLRTKLMHHLRRPRVVVIASAGPRDGKTTTSINVAAVFALRSEARILLVDGDIRRPSVGPQLGLPDGLGLADILSGKCALEDALIEASQIPNLHILTAGTAESNPSELLASVAWKKLVAACAQQYDYIFIDSPPMTAVADFQLIEPACEGVVVVIRQDHTRRRQCFDALRQISKDKLLGVIVNAVTKWPLDGRQQYDMYYTTYQKSSPASGTTGQAR